MDLTRCSDDLFDKTGGNNKKAPFQFSRSPFWFLLKTRTRNRQWTHFPSGLAQKSPNFLFTTTRVFPTAESPWAEPMEARPRPPSRRCCCSAGHPPQAAGPPEKASAFRRAPFLEGVHRVYRTTHMFRSCFIFVFPHTMDERNPAPQKPWKDESPVNTKAKIMWCFFLEVAIHSI